MQVTLTLLTCNVQGICHQFDHAQFLELELLLLLSCKVVKLQ